ncbi:MAG: glycosyltransferase family 9 protein, partial [Pseudomonadota bacterium]
LVFLFRRLSSGRPRPRPDRIRQALLVSTTGLGDTVISTAAMALAREVWPKAKIYALVHRRWASLFRVCPFLDGLVVYPGKFRQVRSLIRRLRELNLDLAVVLHANDPDILPLVWLSRARQIVCRDTTRFNFLVDTPVSFPDPSRHIAERRMDLIRAAGLGPAEVRRGGAAQADGGLRSRAPALCIPEETRSWADEYWKDQGLRAGEKLVVLNPGGSRQAKRWPGGHWRELIRLLSGRPGLKTALFGSPAEAKLMQALSQVPGAAGMPVVARSDVLEAAALLEKAAVLIGPDSGLVHLAAALGVAVAALFGPDNPTLSAPYLTRAPAAALQGQAQVCPDLADCHKKVCPNNVCLSEITPQSVLDALKKDLNFPLDFQP